MKKVYLDNAASTPLDPEVFEKMVPYFLEHHGNPSAVHSHGRVLRAAIEQSRKKIAGFLGASPGEIFFTSGGTEADNTAIKCCVRGLGLKHVITTRIEHHAVTHTVEELEKEGVTVTWLQTDEYGLVSPDALEAALKDKPKTLVSVMHGNNEVGTINDIVALGKVCEKYDAVFHSDTVQTMGNERYNLAEMPVHFIAASAHKFYGPKGVGFLYIKSGTMIPPMICGGSQERNMRAGTENVAGIVGMAAALEKCYEALDSKNDKLWKLKHYMKQKLQENFSSVAFNGKVDEGASIPTVLNVYIPSVEEDPMLVFNLDINGISVSGGSACTSGSMTGSHVLSNLGCEPKRAANSVRFSFGIQNTTEEIDYVIEKLKEIVQQPAEKV